MRKLKILLMAFVAVSIDACSNSESYDLDVEKKREILANKSGDLYIREFSELPNAEKYVYFSNKIDQVKNELLSNDVTEFVDELESIKITCLQTEADSTKFVELKSKLISISERLPDEDFINIFNSLKNYQYSGLKGSVTGNIRQFLLNDNLHPYGNSTTTGKDPKLPDCNCNWACDYIADVLVPGGTSEKGCNPTDSGCGPFGTSGCYRVIKSGGTVVDV